MHDHFSKIVVNRLCHMVFGLIASPFLLSATLRCHLSQFRDEHPEFVRKMIESFYVDDLVTGKENTSDAYSLLKKSKNWLAGRGFKL